LRKKRRNRGAKGRGQRVLDKGKNSYWGSVGGSLPVRMAIGKKKSRVEIRKER